MPDLARKIRRYIRRYNNAPKPIRWSYRLTPLAAGGGGRDNEPPRLKPDVVRTKEIFTMNPKPYLAISGFIFFLVGLLHFLRLIYRWPAQVGTWPVPTWVSYFGLVVAWGLCAWAYRLHRR